MKDKKKCSTCGEVKAVELFVKNRGQCRACKAEHAKAYRQANKEKRAEYDKAYRQANKDKIAEAKKAYRLANPEKVAEKKKAYNQANKEKIAEKDKAHYQANKEKVAEKNRAYKQANPEKVTAQEAKRRAAKLQATPIWYPEEKAPIESLYGEAKELNAMGMDTHVDHIIPLQNDLVCGLHTLANLQLLTAKENLSKHNRFTPG